MVKLPRHFFIITSCCILIWLGLFIDRLFLFQSSENVAKFAAKLEFVVNILILISAFKIYRHMEDKMIWRWFTVSNVALFFTNSTWYLMVYLNKYEANHGGVIHFIAFLVPFFVWISSTVYWLLRVLQGYILNIGDWIVTLSIMAIITILIIFLLILSINYAVVFSMLTISQVASFIILLNSSSE